jgi:transcriptional regulator of aromatic amino acid metabolism
MRRIYSCTYRSSAQANILIRVKVEPKDLLANAIHNESIRQDGPFFVFVFINPQWLMINELRGMMRIFQQKTWRWPSKFEMAQGGSLYFQDVDALPWAQSVLLNVLDLGLVQRLGSDHPFGRCPGIASSSARGARLLATSGQPLLQLSAFEIHRLRDDYKTCHYRAHINQVGKAAQPSIILA